MPFAIKDITVHRGSARERQSKMWTPYTQFCDIPKLKSTKKRTALIVVSGRRGVVSWAQNLCKGIKDWNFKLLLDHSVPQSLFCDYDCITFPSPLYTSEEDKYSITSDLAVDFPDGIDLVHNSISNVVPDVANILDIPVVETVHGWIGSLKHNSNLDAVVLVSKECWGPIIEVPDVPAYLISNGVDTDFWQPTYGKIFEKSALDFEISLDISTKNVVQLGVDIGKTNVVWCGRFSREKDPQSLYEIALRLVKDNSVHFYIAGNNLAMPRLSEGLEKLPNCTILGFREKAELRNVFSQCDIILNTSLHEGISYSMLEAMACNCFPVVSSTSGGCVDVARSVGYVYTDRNDLLRFLKNYKKQDNKCRKYVGENFSGDSMARQYECVWNSFV